MEFVRKTRQLIWFVLTWSVLVFLPQNVLASGYQQCQTNSTCEVGEFLYNDSYAPISGATCTLNTFKPDNTQLLNTAAMTEGAGGWYSYSINTTGFSNGLYRGQMCCTSGTDYLCLDKGFEVVTDVTTLVSNIWSYPSRSLTSFGSLVSSIWSSPSKTLSSQTLDNGAVIATGSADVTTLQNSIDTLTTKVSDVKTTVDNINTTVTSINTAQSKLTDLLNKWGSYNATDIYDKIKDLSSQITAINTVPNVSSLLSTSYNATQLVQLKNQMFSLKALLEVNRIQMEQLTNKPIIKTWLENGSIIFKTLITNPSSIATQDVPFTYYLPSEIGKDDVIKKSDSLELKFDTNRSAFYVTGNYHLEPKGTVIVEVEVKDVFLITNEKIESLRKQSNDLLAPLKNTSYFGQGATIHSDIEAKLQKIKELQNPNADPEERIKNYNESKIQLDAVNRDLENMKTIVASAGSIGTLSGFIGGVQAMGVWGIMVVLVAGFVFLAMYMKKLSGSKKTVVMERKVVEAKELNVIDEKSSSGGKERNVKKQRRKVLYYVLIGAALALTPQLVGGIWKLTHEKKPFKPVIMSANKANAQGVGDRVVEKVKTDSAVLGQNTDVLANEEKNGVVVLDGEYLVNMRRSPEVSATIVAKLVVDEVGTLEDKIINPDGEEWFLIAKNGKRGWVASNLVRLVNPEELAAGNNGNKNNSLVAEAVEPEITPKLTPEVAPRISVSPSAIVTPEPNTRMAEPVISPSPVATVDSGLKVMEKIMIKVPATDKVYVYSTPFENGDVVVSLTKDTMAQVVVETKRWVKITLPKENLEGWVSHEFVEKM